MTNDWVQCLPNARFCPTDQAVAALVFAGLAFLVLVLSWVLEDIVRNVREARRQERVRRLTELDN